MNILLSSVLLLLLFFVVVRNAFMFGHDNVRLPDRTCKSRIPTSNAIVSEAIMQLFAWYAYHMKRNGSKLKREY